MFQLTIEEVSRCKIGALNNGDGRYIHGVGGVFPEEPDGHGKNGPAESK